MKKQHNYKTWLLAMVISIPVIILFLGIKTANADLLVTPLRVVFEGRDRSAVVTVINTSNTTNTYRMGWKLLRMTPDGQYEEVPEDDNSEHAVRARKLVEMVRFSPRQVVIEPGDKQRVRLSLRKLAELESGDYRAHLDFNKLPAVPEPSDEPIKGAKFNLYVQLSFTIPVILRVGDPEVNAMVDGVTFTLPKDDVKNRLSANISLSRTGKNAAYGKLQAYWTPNNGGKEQKIGLLNNVSVYPELSKRTMRMPLDVDHLEAGSIRITYEGDGEYRGTIWDEKTFPIK